MSSIRVRNTTGRWLVFDQAGHGVDAGGRVHVDPGDTVAAGLLAAGALTEAPAPRAPADPPVPPELPAPAVEPSAPKRHPRRPKERP